MKVKTTINARHEPTGLTVVTDLSYDTFDPCAVTVVFHEPAGPVPWEFARDLLDDAFRGQHTGLGDVRIWMQYRYERLMVALTSPEGDSLLSLPARHVRRFLDRTYVAVPRGTEQLDVDRFLAAVLSGEGT